MKFTTWENKNGRNYVNDFLSDIDVYIRYKILDKLTEFESLDYEDLFKAEHIKKIDKKLFETRIKIDGDCYRFFGPRKEDVFWFVHAIKKKSNKIPMKDIKTTKERLKQFE